MTVFIMDKVNLEGLIGEEELAQILFAILLCKDISKKDNPRSLYRKYLNAI